MKGACPFCASLCFDYCKLRENNIESAGSFKIKSTNYFVEIIFQKTYKLVTWKQTIMGFLKKY